MTRAILAKVAVLSLTVVGMVGGSQTVAHADSSARAGRLSAEEQAEMMQYATDTWRSFQLLAQPSGLPADSLSRDGSGWGNPSMQTSPFSTSFDTVRDGVANSTTYLMKTPLRTLMAELPRR